MAGCRTVDAAGLIGRQDVEVDLCRPTAAIDLSKSPPTKRADVHLQVARAHRQQRDYDAVLPALERAARESMETVRRRPFARQAVLELADHRGQVGARARKLASTIGLVV
jgi:hypothetical protein